MIIKINFLKIIFKFQDLLLFYIIYLEYFSDKIFFKYANIIHSNIYIC